MLAESTVLYLLNEITVYPAVLLFVTLAMPASVLTSQRFRLPGRPCCHVLFCFGYICIKTCRELHTEELNYHPMSHYYVVRIKCQ